MKLTIFSSLPSFKLGNAYKYLILHVNTYGEHQSITTSNKSKTLYSQTITSRDLNGKILSTVERMNGKTIRKNYMYDSNGRLIKAKSDLISKWGMNENIYMKYFRFT